MIQMLIKLFAAILVFVCFCLSGCNNPPQYKNLVEPKFGDYVLEYTNTFNYNVTLRNKQIAYGEIHPGETTKLFIKLESHSVNEFDVELTDQRIAKYRDHPQVLDRITVTRTLKDGLSAKRVDGKNLKIYPNPTVYN